MVEGFSVRVDKIGVLQFEGFRFCGIFFKHIYMSRIRVYDQDDYTNLQFSREVVASEGRRITFWQQMFGNLGNFSSDQFFD